MIDEKTKQVAMKYAVAYKDIYINEGSDAFVTRVVQDYNYGFINHAESFVAQKLADIYIAVATEVITRKEGCDKQKQLLNLIEIEDNEVVKCDYPMQTTAKVTGNKVA